MIPTDELEGYPRPSRVRRIVIGTIALVAVAAAGVALLRPAPRGDTVLPEFDLPLIGAPGTLSSESLQGRAVVVNFWASWCDPCRDEIPLLEAAWRKYRGQGLVVVGVNILDTEDGALDFLRDTGMTYPAVRDPERSLADALDVYGLPYTFFVGRDGRLVGEPATGRPAGVEGVGGTAVLGAISRADLEAGIRRILGR